MSSTARKAPKAALRVFLLSLVVCCQLVSNTSEVASLEAPNEMVGYKACIHLMIRLVNCLIEACDRYLNPKADNPVQYRGGLAEQNLVAAIGPLNGKAAPQSGGAQMPANGWHLPRADHFNNRKQPAPADGIDGAALANEEDKMPSTKPMNWVPPNGLGYPPPPAKPVDSAGDAGMQTSGISTRLVEWVRLQLLVMRGQLQTGSEERLTLANCLHRFAEISEHVAEMLAELDDQDSSDADELDFILEAVGVMAEIEESTRTRSVSAIRSMRDGKKGIKEKAKESEKNAKEETTKADGGVLDDKAPEKDKYYDGHARIVSEREATEAIKLHYAYLTQIITSFHVLFEELEDTLNGINSPFAGADAHLIGL